MSNVGTVEVGQILPGFTPTGDRNYIGRHRVTPDAPLAVRAARRIAQELNKPAAWASDTGTAAGNAIANRLTDDHADRVYDLVTGQTFRDVADRIARTWRTLDRAAYGRIPKTWRHRLETRANTRRLLDEQQHSTEAWWAARKDDYGPAFGIHTPTQSLHVIEEKTNA